MERERGKRGREERVRESESESEEEKENEKEKERKSLRKRKKLGERDLPVVIFRQIASTMGPIPSYHDLPSFQACIHC